MSIKKIVLGSLICSSILLAGCSSTSEKIDKLSTDIQTVNQKVDVLQDNMVNLKQETDTALTEATRANQRLDNQVKTFRK